MANIKIADLVQAELWTQEDFIQAPELKNILNSGLLTQDAKLQSIVNNAEAGFRFEMPYIDEPDYSEPDGMDDSDDVATVNNYAPSSMMATLGLFSKTYGYANIASAVSKGTDPAVVFRDIVGNYWGRDLQSRIIAGAVGIAKKAGAALTLDVADDSTDGADVLLDSSVTIDAVGLQGDVQDKFSYMFIHSKVYADLKKQGLIDTIQPQEIGAKPIQMYGNYQVVVNDLMPVRQGTNKKAYCTLIAQNGLFAYADKKLGADMPAIEPVRNALSGYGAGDTKIITRKGFVLHPVGFSYTKTAMNPTLADLKNDANWSMKLKAKQQKFVAIYTN